MLGMKEKFLRTSILRGPGDGGPSTTGTPLPPGPELPVKKPKAPKPPEDIDEIPMPPPPARI